MSAPQLTPREQARLDGVPEDQLHYYPDTNDADVINLPDRKPRSPIRAEQDQAAEESVARIFNVTARSAAWLDRQDFPDLEWILPGVLPEGLAMLAAAPKIGKSWFVSALGLACAQGTYALGNIKVDSRPVLYFALEDGHRRLQSRLRSLNDDHPLPDYFVVITEVTDINQLIVLAEFFQDRYHSMAPPLIIIDTLGRVSPGRSAAQSQYEADYNVGAVLQGLAKRVPGSAVLVVHHTNKGAHDDFLNAVSGTQGVAGAYDSILVLNRDRKSSEGVLSVTGRDIENETEYGIRSEGGKWSLIGGDLHSSEEAVAEIRAAKRAENFGELQQQVLEIVEGLAEGDSTTPAEIALKLNKDNKIIGSRLGELVNAGLIKKAGRGRYAPRTSTRETRETRETVEEPQVEGGKQWLELSHPQL